MNHRDDQQLDARLRDVPIPAGIAGRVAREALFDDAAIDRALARVAVPHGLRERVLHSMAAMRAAPAVPLADASWASRPAGPVVRGEGRLKRWVRRMRLWPAARELFADGMAVAAALSIVAAMFFAGTELSRRLAAPSAVHQRVAVRDPLPPRQEPARNTVPGRRADAVDGDTAGMTARLGTEIAGGRPSATETVPSADAAADVPQPPAAPTTAVEVRAAPAAPLVAAGDRGAGTVGIRTVSLPRAGRQVPRVPGYDIAFEMAHGESPFVDPSVSASLAVDRPPLSLRTDSFDSLCDAARRDRGRPTGRRPRRGGVQAVRTEEILAALPAAPGDAVSSTAGMAAGPSLSLHAVRSLRPVAGSMFVEVCVVAPPLAAVDAAGGSRPLDVMLVLDQSVGTSSPLSWQWLCGGLGRVIAQMGPADRLSLVVCGERPRLAALRADAATLAALLPELIREPAARSADFDAAFRLVDAVGRREGRPDRIVAAAHAVTIERCRTEARDAFAAWQAEAAAATTAPAPAAFVLIDPQAVQATGGGSTPSSLAGGRIAADPVAISRGFVERVFGRPTLVASGCRLEVAFDPGSVGSYRLVGHRQTAADALSRGDQRGFDLHAGESARVVYEVIRRPGGPEAIRPGVAVATLAWIPVGAGPDDRHPERTQRKSLADGTAATADLRAGMPSPHGCELLLAVALGELASGSIHAEPWRQAAAGIAGVVSRWQVRGDVTSMGGQLIDCLKNQGMIPDTAGR